VPAYYPWYKLPDCQLALGVAWWHLDFKAFDSSSLNVLQAVSNEPMMLTPHVVALERVHPVLSVGLGQVAELNQVILAQFTGHDASL
jgi:acetoacetate decarboxylase